MVEVKHNENVHLEHDKNHNKSGSLVKKLSDQSVPIWLDPGFTRVYNSFDWEYGNMSLRNFARKSALILMLR